MSRDGGDHVSRDGETTTPRVRDARADDYPTYAGLFPALEAPDPVPTRARFEAELASKSFVIEARTVVAWGLIEALDGVGYVRNVIVDRSARRRGLGRAVMQEAARRFRAAGCTRWCLNVHPDNHAAVALYRSFGMREAYASVALRMAFAIRDDLPVGDTVVDAPPAEAIGALEEAMAVPAGMVAGLLAREDRVVRAAYRDGEVVGLACFDPGFPGCFPFRARSIEVVRALFDAFAPHARSDELQIVIEDQPALADALERAGARRVLAFLHFEGPLPE